MEHNNYYSFVAHVLTNYSQLLLYISYDKIISTCESLQSVFLYQLQLHSQHVQLEVASLIIIVIFRKPQLRSLNYHFLVVSD